MAEVLNEYISVAAPDSLHIIMPQPCIGRYISHNIVEKYLNRSQLPLEPYLPLIDQHYSFLRQIESNYYTIFTEEGLQNLIESRTCDDSPKELIPYTIPKLTVLAILLLCSSTSSGEHPKIKVAVFV